MTYEDKSLPREEVTALFLRDDGVLMVGDSAPAGCELIVENSFYSNIKV